VEWLDALKIFVLLAPEAVFILGTLFIVSAFYVSYAFWKLYHDLIDYELDDEEIPDRLSVPCLTRKTPSSNDCISNNYCIKESKRMTTEQQRYYAEKEQLLARTDCLIRELAQLQQTGPTECILCPTNQLVERLKELSALRQTSACRRRRYE